MYFREWAPARKRLIQSGFSAKEADAERKRIHDDEGLPESSKHFNKTSHPDKFFKACRAICGTTQIDVDDQARKRLVYTIEQLGLDDDYLNHLVRAKKAGVDWRATPADDLRHLLYTAKKRAASKSQ